MTPSASAIDEGLYQVADTRLWLTLPEEWDVAPRDVDDLLTFFAERQQRHRDLVFPTSRADAQKMLDTYLFMALDSASPGANILVREGLAPQRMTSDEVVKEATKELKAAGAKKVSFESTEIPLGPAFRGDYSDPEGDLTYHVRVYLVPEGTYGYWVQISAVEGEWTEDELASIEAGMRLRTVNG